MDVTSVVVTVGGPAVAVSVRVYDQIARNVTAVAVLVLFVAALLWRTREHRGITIITIRRALDAVEIGVSIGTERNLLVAVPVACGQSSVSVRAHRRVATGLVGIGMDVPMVGSAIDSVWPAVVVGVQERTPLVDLSVTIIVDGVTNLRSAAWCGAVRVYRADSSPIRATLDYASRLEARASAQA